MTGSSVFLFVKSGNPDVRGHPQTEWQQTVRTRRHGGLWWILLSMAVLEGQLLIIFNYMSLYSRGRLRYTKQQHNCASQHQAGHAKHICGLNRARGCQFLTFVIQSKEKRKPQTTKILHCLSPMNYETK